MWFYEEEDEFVELKEDEFVEFKAYSKAIKSWAKIAKSLFTTLYLSSALLEFYWAW